MDLFQGFISPFREFVGSLESISAMAYYIKTVEMFPVFLSVHYLLVAIALRERGGSHSFARDHPLCSWVVCVCSCLGGSIILHFLLGLSLLDPFKNEKQIIFITVIWYLVFFSPFDIIAKILRYKVIQVVLVALKEFHRVRMIMHGIAAGLQYHPDSLLIIILLGAIKGSGAKFLLRPLDHFVRGQVLASNELQRLHFSTKASVVMSCLLALIRTHRMTILTEDYALVGYIIMMTVCQVSFLLLDIKDPFITLEKVTCYVFLQLPQELLSKEYKAKSD